MYTIKAISALLFAAAAVSAAPTGTTPSTVSKTVSLTGVTHSVVAGLGGLRFDPDNVVAEVGDIVEWHFLPKNHSVAQSSFSRPCVPQNAESFFSGFVPTNEGQAKDVFQIVVKDKAPIWYYCAQGNHCESGMVGVVNQNFNSVATLAAHKKLAAAVNATVIPPTVQGFPGTIPNPFPDRGF